MKTLKSQGGFSFIEALVTIGIMGVLASIALPQFANQSDAVKMSEITRTLEPTIQDADLQASQGVTDLAPSLAANEWVYGKHVDLNILSLDASNADGRVTYTMGAYEAGSTTNGFAGSDPAQLETITLTVTPNATRGQAKVELTCNPVFGDACPDMNTPF